VVTLCVGLAPSSLIDSSVLGVVCFACLWKRGLCLQAKITNDHYKKKHLMMTMNSQLVVAPDQMLFRGLKLVVVSKKQQKQRLKTSNCATFKKHYGIHPNHASRVWQDLPTATKHNARIDEEGANLQACFWVLNFVCCAT